MAGRRVTARTGALAAVVVAALLGAACSDDDSADETLPSLPPSGSDTAGNGASGGPSVGTGTAATSATGPATTVPPGEAGAGFVSINVRLSASGIDETLTLDRATVAADELDERNLDAHCTALDGGDGLVVSVVDLRRIPTGSRLAAATLRVDGEVTGGGDYEATLEVGDAALTSTSYTGTVTVDDTLATGSFDTRGADGSAATGTFVCADHPVVTTTIPTTGGGEDVPGSEPTDSSTTSTLLVTLPPTTTTAPTG